jgi:transcriptional regulator GlxA family with amidase domain
MQTIHRTLSLAPRLAGSDQPAGQAARLIGIVVFDGFSMLPAAEVVDVFDKANQVLAMDPGDAPSYRTAFVSRKGGCVSSSAQIDVLTQSVEAFGKTRALFIASGEAADTVADAPVGEWLREVEVDETFAIGNPGSYEPVTRSGVRHALELVRQDFGVPVLQRVLEMLPDSGLSDFVTIASDTGTSIKQKILESAQWIARNCNKSISITMAAQTAGMSERSYLRHFRAEMGVKPSEHLRRSRVELAAAMLESSDLPVDKIARRCGLTSGECLARLFRQIRNVSPTEYRAQVRLTHIGR